MSSTLHRLAVERIFAAVRDRSLQSNDFKQLHVPYWSQSNGSDKLCTRAEKQALLRIYSRDTPQILFTIETYDLYCRIVVTRIKMRKGLLGSNVAENIHEISDELKRAAGCCTN